VKKFLLLLLLIPSLSWSKTTDLVCFCEKNEHIFFEKEGTNKEIAKCSDTFNLKIDTNRKIMNWDEKILDYIEEGNKIKYHRKINELDEEIYGIDRITGQAILFRKEFTTIKEYGLGVMSTRVYQCKASKDFKSLF
jgi:hypothetical protein